MWSSLGGPTLFTNTSHAGQFWRPETVPLESCSRRRGEWLCDPRWPQGTITRKARARPSLGRTTCKVSWCTPRAKGRQYLVSRALYYLQTSHWHVLSSSPVGHKRGLSPPVTLHGMKSEQGRKKKEEEKKRKRLKGKKTGREEALANKMARPNQTSLTANENAGKEGGKRPKYPRYPRCAVTAEGR